MLLAKPEEQEVRVDTKRRDERAVKWLRGCMISRASGGVSRRWQAKTFCLCWRTEGLSEGRREHRQRKKLFLPVFASKRLLSSYTGRGLEGEKRESPRDKPKLAETSLGLWKGTAVKLRGRRGNQPTRTTGNQPGAELCISTEPAQEHLTGMSEQVFLLFQQQDRRHIRRKYIPLNILKWMLEWRLVCNKEANIPTKCQLYKLCYFDVCTALLTSW